MERDMPMGNIESNKPLEIDIRKILEQLGIQKDKWPEEYQTSVSRN